MALVDQELNWHDGNLVSIGVTGFASTPSNLELIVDLYADNTPQAARRRYRCVGANLGRFIVTGDIGRLKKNSESGHVDFMRMEFTETSEILVVSLFGGTIEAEASSFELTEFNP